MSTLPNPTSPSPVPSNFFNTVTLPTWTLTQREVVRFLRQKNRVVGALATPIVFWFVIGSGMGSSFKPEGAPEGFTYLEYFFPGTLLLIMLFTAIFSTISIIEDRREGFLQGVLTSPISRSAIVLGKLFGGAILALIQAVIFLALAPIVDLPIPWLALPGLIALLFVIGFGLTALGYIVAWPLDSTSGFHAIMNLFLIPLWLLSGALFPPTGAMTWVKWIILFNPLHYGLAAIRYILISPAAQEPSDPPFWFSIAVLLIFAAALLALCTWLTKKVRAAA
jgi:ABC-2 type transport system permease protein